MYRGVIWTRLILPNYQSDKEPHLSASPPALPGFSYHQKEAMTKPDPSLDARLDYAGCSEGDGVGEIDKETRKSSLAPNNCPGCPQLLVSLPFVQRP